MKPIILGSIMDHYNSGEETIIKDQNKFIQKLMNNNLLTIRAAENVVRVLPPLNVNKKEINMALKIIKKVCKEL